MSVPDLKQVKGKKVFVGLSGGVDSAVTAALLQKAGADVTGIFIKGWYPPGMPCTWSEDRRDAMRVAAHLRLPFITLDASEEYRRGVIEYLIREYKAGRTPNPDIMCNREVKFGAFFKFARAHGADYIATGHYAQTKVLDNGVTLLRGIDDGKDQSYFLWAVPAEALQHTLLPLGGMQKSEVRALAEEFNLPNAQKRDSQGICFLGNISVEEFLAGEFGTAKGNAVDKEGKKVGTHNGALLHTLGQRVHIEGEEAGPWFVVAKDIEANTLTVSHEKAGQERAAFILQKVNWFEQMDEGALLTAQYRYHGPRVEGRFDAGTSSFIPDVPVDEPVAAGQSLVLYIEERCVGGGIIA